MSIEAYGWDEGFAESFAAIAEAGTTPGRVVLEQRQIYQLLTDEGEVPARVTGRLRHQASGPQDLPAIGDWVALKPPTTGGAVARMRAVLPRRSAFSRKVAGSRTAEQVVAANVDRLFIVMGLDRDFSLRRLERYLAASRESGAEPIVVLNKADLDPDPAASRKAAESVAGGARVVLSSCLQEDALAPLETLLEARKTVALVGSSGVGKSTLINRLNGADLMRTSAVRARDQRGQHTTRHRQLVRLRSGALLIDNPGIRELQLWQTAADLDATFADVESLARECRFRDCSHGSEPGCAVVGAVAAGELPADRLESLHSLQRELEQLRQRQDEVAQLERKRRWRTLHRAARKHRPRSL